MPSYVAEVATTKPASTQGFKAGVFSLGSPLSQTSLNPALAPWPTAEFKILDDLSRLSDDWDEEGALAPSAEAISKARNLILNLVKASQSVYDLGPGPNGDVSVEIRSGLKSVEFVLYGDRAFFVRFLRPEHTESGVYRVEELADHLRWLND